MARNPSLAKQLFGYAILGFALTEATALFALMMAFIRIPLFFNEVVEAKERRIRGPRKGKEEWVGGLLSLDQ